MFEVVVRRLAPLEMLERYNQEVAPLAVASWSCPVSVDSSFLDRFGKSWLLEPLRYIPPAEKEEMFYSEQVPNTGAGLKQLSLH